MTTARSASEAMLAPAVSAGFVLAAGAVTLSLLDPGPLSVQMAQHLFVMNIAMPLLAIPLLPRFRALRAYPGFLWMAALAQIGLLWAWHLPSVQLAAAASFGLHLILMALLALAALAFWMMLLATAQAGRWRALACLLLTGKLACLLGALMIFATRDLYALPGLSFPLCSTGPSTLDDQQLAGLLMITACPLSYLVAGVVLAAQMFARLENTGHPAVAAG